MEFLSQIPGLIWAIVLLGILWGGAKLSLALHIKAGDMEAPVKKKKSKTAASWHDTWWGILILSIGIFIVLKLTDSIILNSFFWKFFFE